MEFKKTVALLMLLVPSWVYANTAINKNRVSVCYSYSCNKEARVELSGREWMEVIKTFSRQANSSHEEREKISKAIALMERLVGRRLGTSKDKARNSGTGEPGQMDCIDESRNTTAYLEVFKQNGWIRWHQVMDRAVRRPYIFDDHWTAVIKDNHSNQLYAVDSWYRANGEEPLILRLEDWMEKQSVAEVTVR